MASIRVYIVFLTAIGVAALPINRLKLPPDYHTKDFVRELSKQSPNYEKVGQFFKGFYLAVNGLRDTDKVDEFRYRGNSSVHKRDEDLGGRGQGWKDPRRREIGKSVNVSIMLLTPSPDIIEKSLGFHKKVIQHSTDNNTDYAKVLNRTKKHHHKLNEKISFAVPVNVPKKNASKHHHKLGEKISVSLLSKGSKGKGLKDKRLLFGIASFLLWLIVAGFVLYYFCSNKHYQKYLKLQQNGEKMKVKKMTLSMPSEALSMMPSEDPSSATSTEEEEDQSEKKDKKRSRKKSRGVQFASEVSEDTSRAEGDTSRGEDSSQSASAKPSAREKKTRQSLKLLKTLFNKVLSSEAIPMSQSESAFTVESNKPIKSQEHYSSENLEKFKLKFSSKDSPIHLDLRRAQPHPANLPPTQLTATEIEPRPYFSPQNNTYSRNGQGWPFPSPESEERFSTPLIKEDYDVVKYDKDSSSKTKKSVKKCKKKPLTMDKPVLDEDFKNLKDPCLHNPMKAAKKSCITRKKNVTFSRVIKVKTYVVKTAADKFDKCFHVSDDGSPWFRVYRKSKTPMNSPANDPLYKYPPKGHQSTKGGTKDDNKNYSIKLLLKQKLKHKK